MTRAEKDEIRLVISAYFTFEIKKSGDRYARDLYRLMNDERKHEKIYMDHREKEIMQAYERDVRELEQRRNRLTQILDNA